MSFHPLFINWENRSIHVIGAGTIAERKINSLLPAKANIHVFSPAITPKLQSLAMKGEITWHKKYYEGRDCEGAFFVIAATNDHALNRQIMIDCQTFHVPLTLNIAEHETGNAIMPAIITEPSFQLAISSNGKNPKATKQLKETIQQILHDQK